MSDIPGEPAADVVPAGFVRRWAALFLDSLILSAGFYGLFFIVVLAAAGAGSLSHFASDSPPAWFLLLQLALVLLYFIGAGLYYGLMESSASQATVGKMAVGIKVVDEHGARLRFAHALGRWAAASLSYLTLYVGFLMAAFTQRKQALHDLIARTHVVDQWAYTAFPERQRRGLSGCLLAFLIAALLLPVLAILAAIAIPAYHDYLQRAHAAQALANAAPIQRGVEEHLAQHGECPWNDSPGFQSAAGYADARIRQVEIHALQDGRCAIVIDLAGFEFQPAGDRWIELALVPGEATWTCRSPLPARLLPRSCRD